MGLACMGLACMGLACMGLACMGLACMGLVRSKWSGEHLFAALFPFTVSAEL